MCTIKNGYFALTLFLLTMTALLLLSSGCKDNATSVDQEPPSVSITSPTANETVSGEVMIIASATDNESVDQVSFYVNGQLIGSTSDAPWMHSWATSTLSDGNYVITASATDEEGNTGSSSPVVVVVDDGGNGDDGGGDDGGGDDGGDDDGGDDDSDDDNPGGEATTVVVTNQLATAINVYVNSSLIGSVPAGETAGQDIGEVSTLEVSWSVVKTETSDGTSIGDDMSGGFDVVSSPSGTIRYTVDHIVGNQWYFFPLITNQTNVGLLMAVNWELQAENRCNCVVPPNSERVGIGYYRLFTNTRVVAFRSSTNYSGGFIYWDFNTHFNESSIDEGTGAVRLLTTSPPPTGAGSNAPGGFTPAQSQTTASLEEGLSNDHPASLDRQPAAPPLRPMN